MYPHTECSLNIKGENCVPHTECSLILRGKTVYPYTKTVSNTGVVLIKQFLHGPHTNLSLVRGDYFKLSSEISKERQTERGS